MQTLETYIGIEPFTVRVDDSLQLRELAEKARTLRDLPFGKKLEEVKNLALSAMINAYEQTMVWDKKKQALEIITPLDGVQRAKLDVSKAEAAAQHAKFYNIVFQQHPLSFALEQGAGCCRYQGALFFALGYEAQLGDQHFIQAAPVKPGVNSVFNEVINGGQKSIVSIFKESLTNPELDYSRQNPRVFDQAFESIPGLNFYSYHRTQSGLIIAENPDTHIRSLQ